MAEYTRIDRFGGASNPTAPGGAYVAKVVAVLANGTVKVFVHKMAATLGPCKVVNNSPLRVLSKDDLVLCGFINNELNELVVYGKISPSTDYVAANSLVVDDSTSTDLVRITQRGSGNALVVEDSTNPDSTPFVIDASGNVGVGNSSPTAKVDISGAAVISGDLTVDTTTLKVDSTNNRVGIGTTSPTETLDVRGNIYTTGSMIFEGTDNVHETTLTVTDPTADRTITLPNNTGTVALLNDTTYVGTTAITLNRSSANLGLTGITSVAMPGSTSGTLTIQPTAITGTATITFPANTGTVITTGNLSSITSTGTLTGLTLSGTVTLPNSANNQIYTSTTADSALPWANGPVLQGATGWSFYSAISASYRMGFRSNTAGTTKYFWTADSALIGEAPNDADVTNTLNVMGTGRFTSTVTAPTFSGGLASSNLTGQTGMWTSAGRPGATRLYRNDYDDQYNVQTYWTGSRWRLYGYYGSSGHADTHVGYADSADTATSATTATNQSGGYVSSTSVTSSGTIYSTREVTNSYTTTNIRAGSGGSAVSVALHASGVAPQFRVGASVDNVYLRNYEDTAYSNFYAIIVNTSSRSLKQDIGTWPAKPQSAGSAVNNLELVNSLDIVKQLRPVTFRWIHDDYMAQLPTAETRVKALERLNSARQNAGLDPWFGEDLIHKCGRDCHGSTESPCPRYLDWDKGQIGFIAEEVAEVVPQAGRIDAEGNFSGLDGLSMSAIAIAAIKELEARVAALENR